MIRKIYALCTSPGVLFFATIAALALPNLGLALTEHVSPGVRLTNVVLPVSVYWLLMSISRRTGKTVWLLFPLVFFAAFQMVLLYLFGRSVIAVDMFLNLVTTNAGEVGELLNNLLPAVVGVVVVYVPLLVFAALSARQRRQLGETFIRRQRRMSLVGVAAGLLGLAACTAFDDDFNTANDIYPANVVYNLALAVERQQATSRYASTSAAFSYGARATHAADSTEIYVLVVGETARAANFGLYGYNRDTTPRLSRTARLTAFDHALTQSNTTHKSVPMLLSAANAANFDRIYSEKSIVTAFGEAGFHTAFFSNQRPNHSFIDIFAAEADDCRYTGTTPTAAPAADAELLKMVEAKLAERHRKLFVVLHTYGSHFNYRERYTADMAHFRPDTATEARAANRQQLINAYDNSIRSTDALLADIVAKLERTGAQAVMLYTSDHGENIFDDSRRRFLHASPVPTYYDLHVPFVVWTSAAYACNHPDEVSALEKNRSLTVENSVATFHTLLNMAGIDTRLRNDSLSVASAKYTVGRRLYLNDHNRGVTLDKLGLDDEDFDMMRRKGIGDI